jgi:hypothetical protein
MSTYFSGIVTTSKENPAEIERNLATDADTARWICEILWAIFVNTASFCW